MEFLKSLMTSDNAINLGMSMILIGVLINFMPRILGKHFETCDQVRQSLKNEAQQLGQAERYKRLTAEEKGISRLPAYGKAMIVVGGGIAVAALLWRTLK